MADQRVLELLIGYRSLLAESFYILSSLPPKRLCRSERIRIVSKQGKFKVDSAGVQHSFMGEESPEYFARSYVL